MSLYSEESTNGSKNPFDTLLSYFYESDKKEPGCAQNELKLTDFNIAYSGENESFRLYGNNPDFKIHVYPNKGYICVSEPLITEILAQIPILHKEIIDNKHSSEIKESMNRCKSVLYMFNLYELCANPSLHKTDASESLIPLFKFSSIMSYKPKGNYNLRVIELNPTATEKLLNEICDCLKNLNDI